MNFTKLLVISSWIYVIIYILFDLPMNDWYWRAIRGAFSTIFSISLFFFLFKKIDQWKNRTN